MNVSLGDDDDDDDNSSYEEALSSDATGKLVNDPNRPSSSDSIDAGDRHGRLLLAALLENFCRLYEADSKKAERLFSVLCKTLSAMGILDQENVDELAGVRSHYSKAFKSLMLQAKEAVDREDERQGPRKRRSIMFRDTRSASDSSSDEDSSDPQHSRRSDIFSIASSGHRLSLSEWLGFDDTKYHAEFEELGTLGRGGFGAVYHVRNKIDEREYAVKKIAMRRASTNQAKIYREIKTLARLEHPNIIRYFSSWLEHSMSTGTRVARAASKEPLDDSQPDDMLFLMDHGDPSFSSDSGARTIAMDDSAGVVFEASDTEADEGDRYDEENDSVSAMSYDHRARSRTARRRNGSQSSGDSNSTTRTTSSISPSFGHELTSSLPSARSRRQYLSTSVEEIPRPSHSFFSMSLPHTHTRFNRRRRKSESAVCLTLFIQMHLCPTTLRDHIRIRNSAFCETPSRIRDKIRTRTYIDLFRSILEGARYVHRSGLCHRDIKPSNIFLALVDESEAGAVEVLDPESDGGHHLRVVPKLGDFGLVLPTGDDASGEGAEDEDGVGTAIYGAPEQFLRGEANVQHMTSKCDVFALGIVFFEMLHYSSTTAMERAKLLTDLRTGILPEDFVQQNPAEAAVILAMTCHDPSKRPSVEEILEMEIVVSSEERERDEELRRVKEENEELKKTIRMLQQRSPESTR